MIKLPKELKNFNLFIQGQSYAGKALDIDISTIALKVDEISTGLVVPNFEITGLPGQVKPVFTMAEFSGLLFGNVGLETILIAKGSINDDETHDGTIGITAIFNGKITEYRPSIWKAAVGTQDKFTMSCTYFNLIGNGGFFEIDSLNNRFGPNGIDLAEIIKGKIQV